MVTLGRGAGRRAGRRPGAPRPWPDPRPAAGSRGTSLVEVLLALVLLAVALLALAAAALQRARAWHVAAAESALGLAARARVEDEWARRLWSGPTETDAAPGPDSGAGTSDSGAAPPGGSLLLHATWIPDSGAATLVVRAAYEEPAFRRGDTLALLWPEAAP